jgi:hypothetical protein
MHKNIRGLYRGMNEVKRGPQPRIKLLMNENGNQLADSHAILNRWINYYSQLLNVHSISVDRHTSIETHATELLLTDPSIFHVKIAVANLKNIINSQAVIKFWQNVCKQW